MDPLTAAIRYEHRRHAPKHAPCPHCGTPGVRKQTRTRTVRALAYRSILILKVTTAEYRAACGCCRTFRTHLEGVEPKAQYTNAVREAVLDRLLEDRMSVERLQAALRRDFLLDLSAGFVYDCLRWKVAQLDLAAHRAWTVEHFSGTLCVDELHLGRYTLLLATDPLGDFPVAFALVSSNDQDHLARFLRALRDHGLHPKVVVTDGSALYPAVLAQVWPQAQHQLCVFHVLQDLHRTVRAAIRRRRQQRAPRGRSLRGRRDAAATRRRRRRQEAQFVFRHRELILRRPEALSARQRRQLARLLEYVPALRLLRRFMDQVYGMLGRSQSPAQDWQRYARWQADPAFAADPRRALNRGPCCKCCCT